MSTTMFGPGAAAPPFAATPSAPYPGTGPGAGGYAGMPAPQSYPPGYAPYTQPPAAPGPVAEATPPMPGAWAWAAPNAAAPAPGQMPPYMASPYPMTPVQGQPPGLLPPGVPPPGVAPGVPGQPGIPLGQPGPVYAPAPGDPGWRPARLDAADGQPPPATAGVAPQPTAYPTPGYPPSAFPGQIASPPSTAPTDLAAPQGQTGLTAAPFDPHEVAQARAKAVAFDQMAPQVQKYEQAFEALQDLANKAQQKQAEQAMVEGRQGRIDQYYQMASMMAPEDAFTYLRRMEDVERGNADQAVRAAVEMGQQRMMEAVTSVAGPLFAQDLAKQSGLPAEYAERLAMFHPREMENYVPVLQREWAEKQQTNAQLQWMWSQLDQMNRAQQAGFYAQSGAHTVGTGNPVPAAGLAMPFEPGSREHLLSIPGVAQALFG